MPDPVTAKPKFASPVSGDDWLALTSEVLPVGVIHDWAVRADCGAVVVFSGTVRDHAEGRPGVSLLEYEAYEAQVVPKLVAIATQIRAGHPEVGRIALLHRVGPLAVMEPSVVVAVSSPHRPEAFVAARFGIDALKATVPIWKREHWVGGTDWGLASTEITDVGQLSGASDVNGGGR